jgi:hypothetical protein
VHRFPVFLYLLPVVFLLSGCIDGEEETWLARDGSGHLEARYTMPPLVMRSFGGAESLARTLREASARDPHVNLTHLAHHTEKGRVVFEFAGTFDDLRNLCTFPQRQLRDPADPAQPVQAEALFGQTTLTINPRGISVHRRIDLSGVLPDRIRRTPALLGDSTFRYILNLPVKARSSNATTTSNHGRVVSWDFRLQEYTADPMILNVHAPIPLPPWLWLTVGLLILALSSLAITILRRHRRSPHRTPPHSRDASGLGDC